jgi:hypothetical protein
VKGLLIVLGGALGFLFLIKFLSMLLLFFCFFPEGWR